VRLALLEDESAQAETLASWLTAAGHDTHVFKLGKDLLRQANRESFDAFLIDWMLPDDYMIKPIRRLELLSRLDAVWRRVRPRDDAGQVVELPPYRLDLDCRQVLRDGVPVEALTEKEFALAVFLFQNLGRLLSRGHLLEAIWGLSADIPTRTLDTHISRVRKKLDLHPANGFRLVPAYNYGYRLERVAPANP